MSRLTPRQREVLALIADGLQARQIAERLNLSPLTVKQHMYNIRSTYGASSQAHAVALAMRAGELR